MPGQVRVEKEGAIGWIVFDHVERRNAITSEMWQAIPGAAADLENDDDIRVVVLRGEGDEAFVAGADISEFEEKRSGDAALAYADQNRRAFESISAITKPVLAMIHGFCVGGGVGIAVCTDLRYAADDAVFAVPAGRLGLGYPPEGLETLTNVVGFPTALEMFFTARRVDAREALAKGLVNEVVPATELAAHVRKRALQMASLAPLTLRSAKLVVRQLAKDAASRDAEAIAASIRTCYASEDYAEGVRAFLEKRAPTFRGR